MLKDVGLSIKNILVQYYGNCGTHTSACTQMVDRRYAGSWCAGMLSKRYFRERFFYSAMNVFFVLSVISYDCLAFYQKD